MPSDDPGSTRSHKRIHTEMFRVPTSKVNTDLSNRDLEDSPTFISVNSVNTFITIIVTTLGPTPTTTSESSTASSGPSTTSSTPTVTNISSASTTASASPSSTVTSAPSTVITSNVSVTSKPTSSPGSSSAASTTPFGVIMGAAIGGLVALVSAILLIWYCRRKRMREPGHRKRKIYHPQVRQNLRVTPYGISANTPAYERSSTLLSPSVLTHASQRTPSYWPSSTLLQDPSPSVPQRINNLEAFETPAYEMRPTRIGETQVIRPHGDTRVSMYTEVGGSTQYPSEPPPPYSERAGNTIDSFLTAISSRIWTKSN